MRVEYAGACYHVINRGNYRRNLFGGEGAAEAFERTLGEAAKRFGWRIHAYVVMSNHFHLAVELTEPNLSEGMKWLQGTWIRRYNGFRRLIGRPFQGRYKALLVEPGEVFSRICHYIHLNPVRAGVVPAGEVGTYPWSSLPKFVRKDRPAWLEPATVLGNVRGMEDGKAGWRRYEARLAFLADDEESKKQLCAKELSRGWCLGSKSFRAAIMKEAALKDAYLDGARFEGLEPDALREERENAWEERLVALAQTGGVDMTKLGPRKSAPEKVLLAAAMKESSSVSNGWLSERLQMGEPASASQFVRRWMLDKGKKRSVEKLLSRVKT